MKSAKLLGLSTALLLATAGGEGHPGRFSEAERATIQSLSLAALPPLPADPTNRYADLPAAAALGASLFFEQRLSRDGDIACATCHRIDRQFQDDLPRGRGASAGSRRTMPLAGLAWSSALFWDGRRDSLWAQALTPLEDQSEHAGTRAAYAHFLAEHFGDRYERIFGPLPDLSSVPARAGPRGTVDERAAWLALSEAQRDGVDRVFANIGKAIAAFERSLTLPETRFDRFARALAAGSPHSADAELTPDEIAGLRLFIGKANCAACHSGPRFTDDAFHNTGVPEVPGLPQDLGREHGVKLLGADPFNCLGKFSDAGDHACVGLRSALRKGPRLTRAYKTPSLRGAATRPPYMHAGQFATLEQAIDHNLRAPPAPAGTSELRPVSLSERERAQLIAFLRAIGE